MEHHKISKLLNDSTVSKIVTRRWIQINDWSGGQYSVNKNIRFKTPMLSSDLCDYSDANIFLKETIIVEGTNYVNKRIKKLTFKNDALFKLNNQKLITHS